MKASNGDQVVRELEKVAKSITPRIKLGLRKVSTHAYKRLIQETPKGYTGQTRKSWKLFNYSSPKSVSFEISNSSRIMKYLEDGTKAHGPRTAKYLFVPLNKTTALKGITKSSKFGRSYVLTKRVKGIKGLHIVKKRARIVEKQAMLTLKRILSQL